ncbi:MAG: hypothetical protein P1V51_07745 [Deltaproteobacteria bacterium]|nr:hypothetical protein [Deltaproteobacteria bacterium]
MADLKALIKDINDGLRKGQNQFFGGKFDEAYALLDGVEAALAQAAQVDPDDFQVKQGTNKAAKLRKDLDKRTGKATSGPLSTQALPTPPPAAGPAKSTQAPPPPVKAAAAPAGEAATPSAAAAAPARLPGGVSKRIQDTRDFLARGKLDYARNTLEEIERMYAGQFDDQDPDYQDVRRAYDEALAAAEQAGAEAAAAAEASAEAEAGRRALEEEWGSRFQALTTFGHRTGNASELMEQLQRFEAALPVVEAYRAAEAFEAAPHIQAKIDEVSAAVDAWPAFFEESKQRFLKACLDEIESRSTQLDRPVEGKPSFISEKNLEILAAFPDQYAPAFAEDGPERQAIAAAMEALREKNLANRRERAKLITLREDVYPGEDAGEIKGWCTQLAMKHAGTEEVLRVNLVKDDWAEKTGWEDGSGERLWVTRRELYAEVAARVKGQAVLHALYVTKTLRSDETWSSLDGNIMWSEEMLAENA